MKIYLLLLLTIMNLSAFVVNDVKYEGMVHISESVAKRMLTFKIGDDISEEVVDKQIKNYFRQGYFKDISADMSAGILTFTFIEKPIISKVELKGYKEDDDDFKETVLQIKQGTLYNERKVEAAKKRLIDSISAEGKIDSVVEVEVEHLENGSIRLVFLVNEGEKIVINSMKYSGVKGLDSSDFDTVIANKEHQFMGWFWGRNDGIMALAELQYDPLRIRDYYMQYGYLDSKVEAPFVEVDFDHYSAKMSYQVFEGEVYRVSNINVFQDKEVIENEKLLNPEFDVSGFSFCSEKMVSDVIRLKVNEAFNIKTFREDAERIKTKIADLGYAFVQVTPDLRKDKEKHTVEVIYHVAVGEKVFIRNVVIEGNSRTLDRLIRRELYLAPGDMYNLTDLRDSRSALGRTGFFDNTTIEERRVDAKTMDLVVKVKEAPTGNIQLGGGYGSYGGLLLSVSVTDRNIFGSGINVGLKAEQSQFGKNLSFNISNPKLNDSDFSGNFSIYKSDNNYNDYTVKTEGIGLGSGHKFTRHISGYLSYNYSKNAYDNIDYASIDPNLQIFFQSYNKSSVTVSASYDDTDDYYLPRIGKVFSQSVEKAGDSLGGYADFIKTRTTFNCYHGLKDYIGYDVIARYKSHYYYAKKTASADDKLPIAERFYMGGIGSVRGYQSYSLSPTTNDAGTSRRVGGESTFVNSFELSFPLIPKAKMRLAAFYDWGFISGEGTTYYGEKETQTMKRSGYGASLEWFSPVGPIQLVFARPIKPLANDRTSYFEFTIGQRF